MNVVWPLLPLALKTVLVPKELLLPPWLDHEYVKRHNVQLRLIEGDRGSVYSTHSQRRQHMALSDAITLVSHRISIEISI